MAGDTSEIPLTPTDRIMRDLRAARPDHKPCIEDLDPEMVKVLRAKPPAERLSIAWGLWTFARDTLRRTVAAQHPDWSEYEVHCEAARRLLHDVSWDGSPGPSVQQSEIVSPAEQTASPQPDVS